MPRRRPAWCGVSDVKRRRLAQVGASARLVSALSVALQLAQAFVVARLDVAAAGVEGFQARVLRRGFFIFIFFKNVFYRNIFSVSHFTVLYPYRPAGGRQ